MIATGGLATAANPGQPWGQPKVKPGGRAAWSSQFPRRRGSTLGTQPTRTVPQAILGAEPMDGAAQTISEVITVMRTVTGVVPGANVGQHLRAETPSAVENLHEIGVNVKPGQRLDLKELASEAHFACGCGSAWARQRREALPFTSSWGDDPNSQDCEPKTHVDQTRWTVHSAFPASAVGAVGAASSDAEAIEQVLAARNREAEWRRTLIAALQKAEALPGLQRKNQQPSESNASPRWMKAVACTSCKRTAAEASDQQRLGSLASIGTKGMDKDMELSASTGVSVATDPEFQHPKARKQADMSSGKVPPLPQTSRATKEEPESAMGQVTFGCPARPSEERQSCSNNIDRLTGDLPPLPSSDPALRIPAWMIDMEGTDGESGKIVEGATRSPWKISARAAGFRAAAFTINIRSSPEADSR